MLPYKQGQDRRETGPVTAARTARVTFRRAHGLLTFGTSDPVWCASVPDPFQPERNTPTAGPPETP